MTMVFDEKENDFVGKINDFGRYRTRIFNQDDKHVWTLRFENFACQQNESLKEMEKRFDYMIEKLKSFDINLTDTEQTLKLEAALPAEWDDVLKEVKENLEKLNLGNLDKINLDVITEIDKRICTYKKETKGTPKNEESVEVGSSSSALACSKCDSFKTDNDKLIKNAESLALEIKKLKEEKQADEKQILMLSLVNDASNRKRLQRQEGYPIEWVTTRTLEMFESVLVKRKYGGEPKRYDGKELKKKTIKKAKETQFQTIVHEQAIPKTTYKMQGVDEEDADGDDVDNEDEVDVDNVDEHADNDYDEVDDDDDDDDDDGFDHDDHYDYAELDPEVQNVMQINDENEEAFYRRVVDEDVES
ncbi:glutamic acid-rich protein-like [Helianthus annuus]|uniref:glutamic acid-rich protein-like n=1 Tax=Helianthus annuus TaxID=4232 RepID=UPI001652EA72|nr:glutamic acid-rich protein-like [Helianthus annuus]